MFTYAAITGKYFCYINMLYIDARDLKSRAFGRAGSSPAGRTSNRRPEGSPRRARARSARRSVGWRRLDQLDLGRQRGGEVREGGGDLTGIARAAGIEDGMVRRVVAAAQLGDGDPFRPRRRL